MSATGSTSRPGTPL